MAVPRLYIMATAYGVSKLNELTISQVAQAAGKAAAASAVAHGVTADAAVDIASSAVVAAITAVTAQVNAVTELAAAIAERDSAIAEREAANEAAAQWSDDLSFLADCVFEGLLTAYTGEAAADADQVSVGLEQILKAVRRYLTDDELDRLAAAVA